MLKQYQQYINAEIIHVIPIYEGLSSQNYSIVTAEKKYFVKQYQTKQQSIFTQCLLNTKIAAEAELTPQIIAIDEQHYFFIQLWVSSPTIKQSSLKTKQKIKVINEAIKNIQLITANFSTLALPLIGEKRVNCHADLSYENLCIDGTILDWEYSCRAGEYFDSAMSACINQHPKKYVAQLLPKQFNEECWQQQLEQAYQLTSDWLKNATHPLAKIKYQQVLRWWQEYNQFQ